MDFAKVNYSDSKAFIMTIVTKKGDDGKTTLANKETVSKADARVKTYGKLDELVCFL